MTKLVTRGEKGRFQSVKEQPVDKTDGQTGDNGPGPCPVGVKGEPASLVTALNNNVDNLRDRALSLSRSFHLTGLISNNYLHESLAACDHPRDDTNHEEEEYSAGHLVQLIRDVESYTTMDHLLLTAGNVLGYRVIPIMSLAMFVLNYYTETDRGSTFSHILEARARSNYDRYEAVIDLHNMIAAEASAIEIVLFGQATLEENYKSRLVEHDVPLLKMLAIANDVVTTAVETLTALQERIDHQLS